MGVFLLICCGGLAEDGPGVAAEGGDEGGFASLAVGVAELVEALAVVHLRKVCELVVNDVVAEFLCQEYDVGR